MKATLAIARHENRHDIPLHLWLGEPIHHDGLLGLLPIRRRPIFPRGLHRKPRK